MVLVCPRTEERGHELSWVNTQSSCPMKRLAENSESLPQLISTMHVMYECWWWMPSAKRDIIFIWYSSYGLPDFYCYIFFFFLLLPFKNFYKIISWTYWVDVQLEHTVASELRWLTFTYLGNCDRSSTHLSSRKPKFAKTEEARSIHWRNISASKPSEFIWFKVQGYTYNSPTVRMTMEIS